MKLNKLISALFGGALLFGAAACTDEVDYTPAENLTGEGVYLSADESDVVDIPTDASSVSINLYRVNADNVLTVGLSGQVLNPDGTPSSVFSVPTQVTFQAGQTVVPIEIGVEFGSVVPEEEYTLDLKVLGDDIQNPYGLNERNYIITYVPWSEWEYVEVDKDIACTVVFNSWLSGTATMPVWTRKSLVNENKLQFMIADITTLDLSDPEFNPTEDCDWYYILSVDKTVTIKVDDVDCPVVTSNIVDVNYTFSGGQKAYFADAYSLCTEVLGRNHEAALALMSQQGWTQSYWNEEKGLITLCTVFYAQLGTSVYPQSAGAEYVMFPGYQDYWMEFSYQGNFVDKLGNEQAIVQVSRSTDLASYAYVCKPGVLSDADIKQTVEDIKADTDAELVFDETTNLTFTFDEDGDYTIVAVGYDEGGNAVYDTSFTFAYNTVMKESEWESMGWCLYTDGFFVNAWYDPSLGGQTWDVEIQKHKTRAGYYRLVNPYQDWPLNLQYNLMELEQTFMYIHAEDPNGVYIEEFDSGINFGKASGELTGHSIMNSGAAFLMAAGNSFEAVKANGWCGTLENDVITFPAGTLLYSESDYSGGPTYANLDPENPLYANPQIENPNFFYGEGTFCIDMSTAAKAPAKNARSHRSSNATISQRRVMETPAAIKGWQPKKGIRATKMTSREIGSARNITLTR